MYCSISGEVPVEPVVSLKSGHLFERRLIEQQLAQTGTCPVTQQDLAVADLLAVPASSAAVRPRPPTATSIPGLMQIMQNEWDALMLETYTLKQHNQTLRQELAHALYQHDAACRVVARLVTERDEARRQLADSRAHVTHAAQENAKAAAAAASNGSSSMDVDDGADDEGMSKRVLQVIGAKTKALTKGRKASVKALQERVTPATDVAAFTMTSSHPLHAAAKPGVCCVDTHAVQSALCVTGGVDGAVCVFDHTSGKLVQTLKHHKKRVTAVTFTEPTRARGRPAVLSSSVDGATLLWRTSERDDDDDSKMSSKAKAAAAKYKLAHTFADNKQQSSSSSSGGGGGGVSGHSVHPTSQFFLTAAAADASWCFWDMSTGACRARNTLGSSSSNNSNSSSSSGGYGSVQWHPDGALFGCGTVTGADGGVGGTVRVFDINSQSNVATFKGHTHAVRALAFAPNGFQLASADDDGVVKLWDLRKLTNVHTMTAVAAAEGGGGDGEWAGVNSLCFDASSSYLAVGADSGARVHAVKSVGGVSAWQCVVSLRDADAAATQKKGGDAQPITDVRWAGANAAALVTVSMDRMLRVYGK